MQSCPDQLHLIRSLTWQLTLSIYQEKHMAAWLFWATERHYVRSSVPYGPLVVAASTTNSYTVFTSTCRWDPLHHRRVYLWYQGTCSWGWMEKYWFITWFNDTFNQKLPQPYTCTQANSFIFQSFPPEVPLTLYYSRF